MQLSYKIMTIIFCASVFETSFAEIIEEPVEPQEPVEVSFQSEGVHLTALVAESGEFKLLAYPEFNEWRVLDTTMQTFNLGSTPSEICNGVDRMMTMLSYVWLPNSSKERYRKSIEDLNQFRITVDAGRAFRPSAIESGLATSMETKPVFLLNPMQWYGASWQVSVQADARVTQFDDSQELLSRVLGAGQINFLDGLGRLEFSGAHLFCDLWQGRVRLDLAMDGGYQLEPEVFKPYQVLAPVTFKAAN
ncbi:hypothetical protein [Pseudobacteriovorax antillogorgiicola]|uniref:Uncharacterized protein n=1 Tax=Pseudobacteriovorax antillogorgiicola TaxID=1513793 RepID=A0A1Y6BTI3_9BACT|nr:hypothetical protein [Pseudobacteriovorax antillogorgiicola]TCS52958.1 hypothetical protein EDD56_1089 [Pseudobacteriovorax antillogorgiicola]SMF27532.1 hypothetical protein SAMN06296036_108238 [Pseudobacteriovorax antillogorgiicola]